MPAVPATFDQFLILKCCVFYSYHLSQKESKNKTKISMDEININVALLRTVATLKLFQPSVGSKKLNSFTASA